MAAGEDRLVDWLRRRLRSQGEDLLGDDAALIERPGRWAVSVDQQIEGVHFRPETDPRTVGARLVAVCLSDLAACGARPGYGFLTLAVPRGYPARRLLDGVVEACRRFGLTLAGGDVAATPDRPSFTLTVLGGRPPGGRWLRRDSARAGDALWLGGELGGSALGRHLLEAGARVRGRTVELPRRFRLPARVLAEGRRAVRGHLLPEPQLELGARLGRRRAVAALDVSDGLAIDLHRLCRASGVGAELEAQRLPLAPGLERWAAELELDALQLALTGGEDYVLLFTLPERVTRPPLPGCRRIGSVVDRAGVRLTDGGRSRRLAATGWDHLRPD